MIISDNMETWTRVKQRLKGEHQLTNSDLNRVLEWFSYAAGKDTEHPVFSFLSSGALFAFDNKYVLIKDVLSAINISQKLENTDSNGQVLLKSKIYISSEVNTEICLLV